ncbi:hypothetical protein GCM10010441_29310 [Kitasatospora paracochleata]|uniref:Uncharacterized protein n=1 Tax=Kitasatospora paracochleata TaxID=58354 RepID=A0ABT1J8X7_9ACTN|nr:hypothetical protein [Kitasatospora paracochleata]MCP2313892.1 hypothetical protein [Kitasatospora paracochleata]
MELTHLRTDEREPECTDCYGTGRIELYHPSTDALTGYTPCAPECQQPIAESAARSRAARDLADAAWAAKVAAGTEPPL